jgi:hypothetical protein
VAATATGGRGSSLSSAVNAIPITARPIARILINPDTRSTSPYSACPSANRPSALRKEAQRRIPIGESKVTACCFPSLGAELWRGRNRVNAAPLCEICEAPTSLLRGRPQGTCQPSFNVRRSKRIVLLDRSWRLRARSHSGQLVELGRPAALEPLDDVHRYEDVVHATISLGCQGSCR